MGKKPTFSVQRSWHFLLLSERGEKERRIYVKRNLPGSQWRRNSQIGLPSTSFIVSQRRKGRKMLLKGWDRMLFSLLIPKLCKAKKGILIAKTSNEEDNFCTWCFSFYCSKQPGMDSRTHLKKDPLLGPSVSHHLESDIFSLKQILPLKEKANFCTSQSSLSDRKGRPMLLELLFTAAAAVSQTLMDRKGTELTEQSKGL